ncbi:MAG: NAD-dependent epimerase/dehydratase family protein [Candidatus Nezhaarchaeales archaeon]
MRVVVTGGAGFIGSHLSASLTARGFNVTVLDSLASGRLENIENLLKAKGFRFMKSDLKNDDFVKAFNGVDVVFHFAANPEVKASTIDPRRHFEENVIATFNVLEACRACGVELLVFASSSTVYGDAEQIPTPEGYSPLEPISIYGACKLACEKLVTTYAKLYGIKSLIVRYANIIGPKSNHGVIIDFIDKLKKNPRELEILGDGTQKKSYLHVYDAIDATLHLLDVFKRSGKTYDIYNVGNEDWITVKEIADIIIEEMGLKNVKYRFKHGTINGRGWPGDVKFMLLDISKLKATGWKPRWNSREAVKKTVRQILGKEQ